MNKDELDKIAKQYAVGTVAFTPENDWDSDDVDGLLRWVCRWYDAGAVLFGRLETEDRQFLTKMAVLENNIRQTLARFKEASPITDSLKKSLDDCRTRKEYGTQLLDDRPSLPSNRPPDIAGNQLIKTLSDILLAAGITARLTRAKRIAPLLQEHTSISRSTKVRTLEQDLIYMEKKEKKKP